MRLFLLSLAVVTIPWILSGRANNSVKREKPDNAALRRPVALALVDSGKTLLAANRDSGTITVLDMQQMKVLAEKRIGQRLSHMAATPAGDLLVATDEKAGELIVLVREGAALREVRRIATGTSPVSVSVAADGRLAVVACLWPRQLMLFDLKANQRAAPVILDLPFAPRLQLLIPKTSKVIVADSFGGKLALVDLQRKEVESVRNLAVHNIRGLALDEEQKTLLLTHQQLYQTGHPIPNDIRSTNLIANQLRRLRLENVLNPKGYLTRDEANHTIGDIEQGAGDPAAVCDAGDGSILVALAGVHELAIGWPDKAMWVRRAVGKRPTALAVDRERRRAYVANTFSDSISVVDLQTAKVVAEISLGPARKLSAEERGEMLFFDARLSLEGWYSCHSCHTDAHTNGQLNDNRTDGSFGTPKRVLSLLGVKDTGVWAWNGKMTDLGSQIRQSLTSTMQGPEPTDQQVRDLTAFLQKLEPPPSVAKARGTLDEKAVERGRQIFHEKRCVSCHQPPTYTTPKTYDVGLRDEAGNTHFNPPSLRGISQAGPYFHDNRASSLEDVLLRFQHRLPAPLSKEELSDLLQFLGSL